MAVAGGAFGAHGLASRLDARGLDLWETAAKYLMYGGFGLCIVGLAASAMPGRPFFAAAVCLAVGSVIFSGTLTIMALGGPRWLGAITPLGGLGLISGFLLLAWNAWRG